MCFGKCINNGELSQANTKAIRADSRASQLEGELEMMNDRIAVLALACQSLWELLQENTGISAAEFDQKMEEIDLRDGVKDGKMTADHGLAVPNAVAKPVDGEKIVSTVEIKPDREKSLGSDKTILSSLLLNRCTLLYV